MATTNALNWFEIQVKSLEDARKFYSTVIGQELLTLPNMETLLMFPHEGGVGGALSYTPDATPGNGAVMVYLNGGDDLQPMLDRVEAAGGKVTMDKTQIGEDGFIAVFEDPEGNTVGLHSPN